MKTAAESFHVIEFIDEELEARGWTREGLSLRMGDASGRYLLALELLELRDPRCYLGADMAAKIGDAFGTGPEIWLNLDRTWRESQKAMRAH